MQRIDVTSNEPNLIGVGIYSVSEASRLTGVPAGKIRRWLRGNERVHRGERRFDPPLWRAEIFLDDQVYLGFRDLIEVRTVSAFVKEGVSPHRIRRAIEIAMDMIKDGHPLSTQKFRTDGRTIFLHVAEHEGDERLIEIFRGQYEFKKIIEPTLRDVEFELGIPRRWWVDGQRGKIVVDPQRAFGQPVDDVTGIPTSTLADAIIAEGSVKAAAKAYLVPEASVRRAVEFEKRLAA